jgi:hypothetical protein
LTIPSPAITFDGLQLTVNRALSATAAINVTSVDKTGRDRTSHSYTFLPVQSDIWLCKPRWRGLDEFPEFLLQTPSWHPGLCIVEHACNEASKLCMRALKPQCCSPEPVCRSAVTLPLCRPVCHAHGHDCEHRQCQVESSCHHH